MNRPSKIFVLLLLIILAEVFWDRTFGKYFIVGTVPGFIFGILWNLKNGNILYNRLRIKRHFNLKMFNTLSIVSVIQLIIFIAFINRYLVNLKADRLSAEITFMPINFLLSLVSLYLFYYNANFVARGLAEFDPGKGVRGKALLALLFFPVGLFWIQPRVDAIEGQRAGVL